MQVQAPTHHPPPPVLLLLLLLLPPFPPHHNIFKQVGSWTQHLSPAYVLIVMTYLAAPGFTAASPFSWRRVLSDPGRRSDNP